MDFKKDKWNSSYGRFENHIFYPKEEIVKFINRFVRKKVGFSRFVDAGYDFSNEVRALDYGCGIGRQAVLLEEFGMKTYGCDISETAIALAKVTAEKLGYPDLANRFFLCEGSDLHFRDDYFHVTVCESVLDSMHFANAKKVIKEIDRVTSGHIFISLIKRQDDYDGEEVVSTDHERGTIQSYFNRQKLQRLIEGTACRIEWAHIVKDSSLLDSYSYERYYVVLNNHT